jgi:hypothetical protein
MVPRPGGRAVRRCGRASRDRSVRRLPAGTGDRITVERAYISELSVTGQPAHLLFRISDIAAGVGLTVLAAVFTRWPPTAATRTGGVALTTVAAASVVDGVSPMGCAPSIDLQCWRADHASLTAQLAQPHTVSGLIGFTACMIAITAYSAVLRHQPGLQRLAAAGFAAAGVAACLGGIEIAMALTAAPGVGLAERVQVVVISGWLAALSLRELRTPRYPGQVLTAGAQASG